MIRKITQENCDAKVAIVSGSSRGIGRTTARHLLSKGFNVVLNGRDEAKLYETRRELESNFGNRVAAYACSVANYSDCQRLVNLAIHRFGQLDLVVNNAGVSMEGDFAEMNPSVVQDVFDTNVTGSMYLTRAAIDPLSRTQGGIIFVNSCAAFVGIPGYSIYCASKAALSAFADSIRIELKPKGIFVGDIFVGFTENDSDKKILSPTGKWKPQPTRGFIKQQPQSEVAMAIVEMYDQRIKEKTLTTLGQVSKLLSRFAPSVPKLFLERLYTRSRQKTVARSLKPFFSNQPTAPST